MENLSSGGNEYGAQMGRPSTANDKSFPVVFEVERLTGPNDAYDAGGAYWGLGDPVYRAEGSSTAGVERITVRAKDMAAAKAAILKAYPNATFDDNGADLDAFVSGYSDASLFTSTNSKHEGDPENESEMLDDSGYAFSDETLAYFRDECSRFMKENAEVLQEVISASYSIERAGHDFWLTRNRHGAGYWDRGLGAAGEKLTEAARRYGEDTLWVDEQDLIRSEHEPAPSATPRI